MLHAYKQTFVRYAYLLHNYMLTCLLAYMLTCLLACLRTYLPFTPAGTQAQILTHAHVFTLIY